MPRESERSAQPRPAEQKSAVAARQGVISGRVLLVLVTSLILAVAALLIGYLLVR